MRESPHTRTDVRLNATETTLLEAIRDAREDEAAKRPSRADVLREGLRQLGRVYGIRIDREGSASRDPGTPTTAGSDDESTTSLPTPPGSTR